MKDSKKPKMVWWRGYLNEVWGGGYAKDRDDFHKPVLPGLSRALKASMHDAIVIVEEDDERD